jgi:ABC-type nitrate/sulfonate/bicarbonate transport system ATPase subunit
METELLTLWEREKNEGGRASPAGRERKTVVLGTHDLEEAIALADEVTKMPAPPSGGSCGTGSS